MSIQPHRGILNIPNATLRVGKLEIDSTAGFDTVLNNVSTNTVLLEDVTEYTENNRWGLKMPNVFVATFEIQGANSSFNFQNTSVGTATTGYTLDFNGTTLTLKYGGGTLTTATIPNLDATYGKVYLTYEKQYFTVTVDGTQVLAYKDTVTRTPPDGEYVNFFEGTGTPKFENLKVVAGHLISDGTSNVSLMSGNLGIGTDTPLDTLHVDGGIRFAGHIIPMTNAAFDIGSAENKIRDMYVDTNSLWIGDVTKIAFDGGKMKFKKRKVDKVPRMLVTLAIAHGRTDEADVQAHALAFAQGRDDTITTVSDLKLQDWRDYTQTFDDTKAISDIFADNVEDYEAITASEAFAEVGTNIFTNHSLSIGKSTDPAFTLDVEGDAAISSNLVVGTANLFVDTTTGNVGIGKTNPGSALDVVGTVTASSFSGIQVDDVPTLDQNTSGSAASLTTSRTIFGQSFNGTDAVTGNLVFGTGATNKGTIAYPTDTVRTFTIPDTGAAANFVMTEGNQTIGGNKEFSSRITLGTSASIRQSSTGTWTGDPGSGVGKLEYHSNRWYIVAGSNSTELLQIRQNNTDKFTIDNDGSVSLGSVPWARLTDVPSSANTTTVVQGVHAQLNLHGGGNVTFNSSGYLKWDTRIIAIPAKKTEFASGGYIDITCPTSGTIVYYNPSGTLTTKICTADGIPIGDWEALWYVVTPGQGHTSSQTKFVAADHRSTTHSPNEYWLLIASRNGDAHGIFLKYLPGQVNIPIGGGYTSKDGTLPSPTFSGTVTATTFSGALSGNADTATTAAGITYTEVSIIDPDVTSGTWTQNASNSEWGPPKFNTAYNSRAYADFNVPAGTAVYRQWNIPTGMKSAYISQLQWSNCGYVDIHGVQSDNGLVFLRRVNTLQAVENSNEGNPGQHDGSTISFIGSGLDSFTAIRITLKSGRLYLTGLAFTTTLDGTEGTGMVNPAQITGTVSSATYATSAGSVTGKSTIYEATGTTPGVGSGTLVLDHGNSGGTSSIVFPSRVNSTSDYGYISYGDASSNGAGGESARLRIGTSNDGDDHIILEPSGNVGIGTNIPNSYKLHVEGSIYANGAILASGNVTAYSDIRRKKDLVKLDNALNKVEQLTGYTYTNKIDNKRYTGLIAQDVQKVLPEAVQAEKLDGHLSLAYGNMAGLFVEAIKELVHKIEILEARLNVIENNK